jgi:hypothetical protein
MFSPFAFIQVPQVNGATYTDPDAQAFITAAGITDSTQQSAINQLVLGLKTDSIWTKMNALYPFVGGTATTHKFNLKDPRDLDAAYRIQFNGGMTHDANGIQGDGYSAYGNTFAAMNTVAIPNRLNHWSLYNRTISSNYTYNGIFDFSSGIRLFGLGAGPPGNNVILGLQDFSFLGDIPKDAFTNGTVTSNSTANFYRNGSLVAGGTPNSMTAQENYYIAAANQGGGSIGYYSNANIAFASLGGALTATDAANFYTRVQAFQTTLGRHLGTPITLAPITSAPSSNDPDAQAFITAAGISNATQQSAINTLVLDLKAYSIWTKMTAIYPFVGGTATTHKFNLKNPQDTDTARRIQFVGGWTHDANGIQGDTSSTYANTFIAYNTGELPSNNNHWSIYQTTVGTSAYSGIYEGGVMIGFSTGFGKYVGVQNFAYSGAPESTGFWNGTVTNSANGVLYKNGTSVYTTTGIYGIGSSAYQYVIGGFNNSGTIYPGGTTRFAFASLGIALTGTDAANLYTAIQAFQTTLGRQL